MGYQQSIGREKAIALGESKWWEGKSSREIAKFQLFTEELCCPFDLYHKALSETLGRPVYTHELGSTNIDSVVHEFLGEADPPSLQDILNLIPEDKRIVID